MNVIVALQSAERNRVAEMSDPGTQASFVEATRDNEVYSTMEPFDFREVKVGALRHVRMCGGHHDCGWEQYASFEYPKLTEFSEATCAVSLTIGEDGYAKDIVVNCDDAGFNQATLKGLSSLKHSVTDTCGNICPQIGTRIDYPIEYRIED